MQMKIGHCSSFGYQILFIVSFLFFLVCFAFLLFFLIYLSKPKVQKNEIRNLLFCEQEV